MYFYYCLFNLFLQYIEFIYFIYTAVQKFGIKIFNVFFSWSILCSSRLYLFNQKYRKNSNMWNIIEISNTGFHFNIL